MHHCFGSPVSRHAVYAAAVLLTAGCATNAKPSRPPTTPPAPPTAPSASLTSPWDDARVRGIEFRAVGSDAAWILEREAVQQWHFTTPNNTTNVWTPVPPPMLDTPSGQTTYHVKTPTHDLTIQIDTSTCPAAALHEPPTQTVTVQLDGKTYHGCGRPIAALLTNTYWKLLDLDGHPILARPKVPNPHLQLSPEDTRLLGSTGCNSLLGHYTLTGDAIQFGAVATTKMACADPDLAHQEQRLVHALTTATRLAISVDTLALYHETRPIARFVAVYLR
ncbi:MAG TPA: META domain-containing protein [Gemmatimonadaceae bacterium]|jgi:heat shock protein HslJ|nr:META domain-containing protein [Gemmatimonadaceae bacterium]